MGSSINENLDARYTIDLVKLSLNSPVGKDKIWVLVEGEDDCKIYPKFFQSEKCKVEQVHGGCVQLEKAIEGLQKQEKQVVGIRDADFSHIKQDYRSFPNLFYTDYHDIEMTMLYNDSVFKNILHEYFLTDRYVEIKKNILMETSFIGYIRYYNELHNCQLNFGGINYKDMCDKESNDYLKISQDKVIDNLNQRSPKKTSPIDKDSIRNLEESHPDIDLFQLICGHDYVKLLAIRVNFKLKSVPRAEIGEKEISKSLRLSYRMDDFKQTDLFQKLQTWQSSRGIDVLLR
ncbi:MAG: DUF4435 domain-containing protein [Tannerellaceae bacterium]|jgi:hypothetical protein|nr:DUF4435 domain-containing protein [Tannerellaceae bacterium]